MKLRKKIRKWIVQFLTAVIMFNTMLPLAAAGEEAEAAELVAYVSRQYQGA